MEQGLQRILCGKSYAKPVLIDILKEYGCGCDCSSYTELMMSEALEITGEDIMFLRTILRRKNLFMQISLGLS